MYFSFKPKVDSGRRTSRKTNICVLLASFTMLIILLCVLTSVLGKPQTGPYEAVGNSRDVKSNKQLKLVHVVSKYYLLYLRIAQIFDVFICDSEKFYNTN